LFGYPMRLTASKSYPTTTNIKQPLSKILQHYMRYLTL